MGGSGGSGFGGFSDIFDDIFDIFGSSRSNRYEYANRKDMPKKGPDARVDVTLDFFEAIFGVEKEISVKVREECSHCHGSKMEPGSENTLVKLVMVQVKLLQNKTHLLEGL